ncbi:uncharacterized protein LOC130991589 [Salvia miltiorrhiza]|uniref:uncharacterized protein LOC130991589 n=1 Tax=Salvia miltiorrhiza TaxID=226208 RepID=UPI0025AD96B1|nr:uncharacterized protein LOC130991589 [Salvia miltiorrhiza]
MRIDDSDVARELILKAIKLGAIDLTIDVMTRPEFVLPDEVLESQTLTRLSVCDASVEFERRNKPLTSSNLKSLTLDCTLTKGDFSYLSRIFPLLEELKMQSVHLNTEDSLSKSELWLQFPCLKKLVIWNCYFAKAKVKFDVPNIRKFVFVGDDVSRLELKTSSREWESYIHIICWDFIGSASWLRSLKQFVKVLSPSRVSLALHLYCRQLRVEDGFVGDDLAIPAVEDLTISGLEVSPEFLNALLRSFRPNFVDIQRRHERGIERCMSKLFTAMFLEI